MGGASTTRPFARSRHCSTASVTHWVMAVSTTLSGVLSSDKVRPDCLFLGHFPGLGKYDTMSREAASRSWPALPALRSG